jgi:ABC-2 type transport system ATP-binding protein
MNMSVRLRVQDLRKRYGSVQAVDGISFCAEAGEILGLLGPNGAGKTTTVESIAGLCKPDSGKIEVCGIDVRRHPREAKRRMGFALAVTALQDKITPREALESFGAFYPWRAAADELITRFDLEPVAERYFETLSTGQKQRLALALALVNQPELLILDEPSAGLDPEARRNVHASIIDVKESGGTVLMTTHDMDEAQRLCDRIAIINSGRVVAEGSPSDLIAQSRTTTTVSVRLQSAIKAGALGAMRGISGLECTGTLIRFAATNVNEALAQLIPLLDRDGLEITEMHAQRATLEEVVASFL